MLHDTNIKDLNIEELHTTSIERIPSDHIEESKTITHE